MGRTSLFIALPTSDWIRRTDAARRQAETLLQRPVFGVERPLSSARCIRGACGGDVSIERRRGDTETVCDLGDVDVAVGHLIAAVSGRS